MIKVKFEGTATREELEQIIALDGFAYVLGQLKCNHAQKIIGDIVYEAKQYLDILDDDNERVIMADPSEVARMYRDSFAGKTIIVKNCKIGKGKTFGTYTIYLGSKLPQPKDSMPENVKKIFFDLRDKGKVDNEGVVIENIEVSSRNIAACLATGVSTNARRVLSELD